jgi:hypothetical protein
MTIYNRPSDVPAFAESGDRVQPTDPEIQEGWPESTVPPSRQRFNWILNFVANAVKYLLQRGVPEWDTDEDYPLAGRVQHAGATWVAIDANTGIEPGTDPATWERWGYSESELEGFLDPITPDNANNRVGINDTTPSVTFDINGTDAIKVPIGTTAQRPAGSSGYIRFNSTLSKFEGYFGTLWGALGGGATGGGSDEIFWENGKTVNSNYTITAGKNAGVFGPLTIADGVTITVPDDSTLTIV